MHCGAPAGPPSPRVPSLAAACALLAAPRPLPCFAAGMLLRACSGGCSAQALAAVRAQLAAVGTPAGGGVVWALLAEAASGRTAEPGPALGASTKPAQSAVVADDLD